MDELNNLINEGRVKLVITPKTKTRAILFDGRLECNYIIKRYGFRNMNEFENYYNKII